MNLMHALNFLGFGALTSFAFLSAAIAEERKSILVNGKRLEIHGESPPVLVLGKKVILRPPEEIAYLNVQGIYEGAERTFVERHNCGDHSFTVIVDQAGLAWAALYNEGKARFFGDPDVAKKRFLDPSFQPR